MKWSISFLLNCIHCQTLSRFEISLFFYFSFCKTKLPMLGCLIVWKHNCIWSSKPHNRKTIENKRFLNRLATPHLTMSWEIANCLCHSFLVHGLFFPMCGLSFPCMWALLSPSLFHWDTRDLLSAFYVEELNSAIGRVCQERRIMKICWFCILIEKNIKSNKTRSIMQLL